VKIERNRLVSTPDGYLNCEGIGEFETLPAGMVLRSVDYYGVALPGVPYNKKKGTIPNDHGRILNDDGKVLPGAYVVGWAKRGPTGVIGTNKKDAEETVALMLEDVKSLRRTPGTGDVAELLARCGCKPVMFAEWQKMNAAEVERGKPAGRPRVKFITVDEARGA
jgi:ferredoxin--NADP+ reductase